jgi:hypothetical protein
MKYLILPMALISAFLVSAEPDMSDLRSPEFKPTFICSAISGDFEQILLKIEPCLSIAKSNTVTAPNSTNSNFRFNSSMRVVYDKTDSRDRVIVGSYSNYKIRDGEPQETCPPDTSPIHEIPVFDDSGQMMCAKELIVDPDSKCDEFGNNSMLPPKPGVGSEGQNACYINPANGLSCQYVQGGDNFTATGKECTGDENDYGDRPTPEPPPDGADPNCQNYGSQGQVLICDVDPNEGCNPLTINGTTQYQCPSGCGSMDNVYFCSYDDKDGDGIPDDKNGNGVLDKDETCVNGKCKPNTPDDTTPPTTEKPDMTETNTRLDGVIGELDSIGGKISKTNQTLNGINSGIQDIKQGQGEANGLLAGMSKDTGLIADNTDAIAGNTKGLLETVSKTDIGNTFNPDLSTGFYESSYENGFEGIWEEKSILFEQTETIQFLQQFRFNAGGSPPDTQLCFNMGGSMDFGCADLPTPSPQLLAILKIFILITAAFLCRALIFGG